MSNFEERMADAKFSISVPLCDVCKNSEKHKFDNSNPSKPIVTCKILGKIPKNIDLAMEYNCEKFDIDMEKYQLHKDLMPKII